MLQLPLWEHDCVARQAKDPRPIPVSPRPKATLLTVWSGRCCFLSRATMRREPLLDDPINEASEAFEYWLGRAERLPWHRRAQRREARELAARWRVRLVQAQLERVHLGKAEAMAARCSSRVITLARGTSPGSPGAACEGQRSAAGSSWSR